MFYFYLFAYIHQIIANATHFRSENQNISYPHRIDRNNRRCLRKYILFFSSSNIVVILRWSTILTCIIYTVLELFLWSTQVLSKFSRLGCHQLEICANINNWYQQTAAIFLGVCGSSHISFNFTRMNQWNQFRKLEK